MVKSFFTLLLE